MRMADERASVSPIPLEELAARVAVLEEALDKIHRECDHALESPEVVMLTVCRVASVARRALESPCDQAAE